MMIYDYFCTVCGHRLPAREIAFDLVDFLDLRTLLGDDCHAIIRLDNDTSVGRITPDSVPVVDLYTLAERANIYFTHGVPVRLSVTLEEFLCLILAGRHQTKAALDELCEELPLDQLLDSAFSAPDRPDAAAVDEKDGETEEEGTGPDRKSIPDLSHCEAFFWVRPEFFDSSNLEDLLPRKEFRREPGKLRSRPIYTFQYASDREMEIHSVHMHDLYSPRPIRGCCPCCGSRVLQGTGKYRHTLIGLIGRQYAGKTSLIQAMLAELQESYARFGLQWPDTEALCDDRTAYRDADVSRYREGWRVASTDPDAADFYNASVLVRPQDGEPQILTFIDIAGELCYDESRKSLSPSALARFPLINQCQLYLMCVGAQIEADGEEKEQDPMTALRVTRDIYRKLPEGSPIPPLGLVLTKFDLAWSVQPSQEKDPAPNPFREEPVATDSRDLIPFLRGQIRDLESFYAICEKESIRSAMRQCCKAYQEMKSVTYTNILCCSALGRKADWFTGETDIRPQTFTRSRVDELLQWLLMAVGLTAVPLLPEGSTKLLPFPSIRDSHNEEAAAIARVFMNPSASDRAMIESARGENRSGKKHREA